MPGADPKRGDIYNVMPHVVLSGDAHAGPRRMVCVAERPTEYVWTAMSRTTTAEDEAADLFSPADESLGLTKDGWWSYRYLRSVKKRWTGDPHQCPFLASMPEPLKAEVLAHYMSRPGPS